LFLSLFYHFYPFYFLQNQVCGTQILPEWLSGDKQNEEQNTLFHDKAAVLVSEFGILFNS